MHKVWKIPLCAVLCVFDAVAALELRWLLPQDWFGRIAREMVASAFYDAGHIR